MSRFDLPQTLKPLRALSLASIFLAALSCVPSNGPTTPTPPPAPPAPTYEVAAWAPWTHLGSVKKSLTDNMGTIDVAHLFWYWLDSDYRVKGRSYVDPQLVNTLRQNGVTIIPTVTDGFVNGRVLGTLSNSTRRSQHIQDLVDLVVKNNYDGVDLDYENIGASGRDLFSAFVEDLAMELHRKNKLLSITVYSKSSSPGRWNTQKSHDYQRIGAAADRINVMSYGYGYAGGPPNPIGPVHYLEKNFAFAITKIPAKKIFLGIPFYGRDWAAGEKGKSLTHPSVASRIATYNPTISYESKNGESSFTYTKSGVKHTVWFQSPQGIADKMKVVTKYGLGGIAIWRLGNEDPRLWDSIRKGLKPGAGQ